MAGRRSCVPRLAFEGSAALPSVAPGMIRARAALAGVFLALLGTSGAGPAQTRTLLLLNRGSEAIFSVQFGHAKAQAWSTDLLPFNDVVDVGEGKEVAVPLGNECVYDVRATYRGGQTSDVSNVDLCVASSVSFDR